MLSPQKLRDELDGYLDMGMAAEGLEVAEKLLALPKVSVIDLEYALSAVMMMADEPRGWGTKFAAAFRRMPAKTKQLARITMFSMYAAIGEYEKAESFLTVKDIESPRDLALAMDTLLALGKLKDAASVGRQCSVLLNGRMDPLEASHLLRAMASYFERSGEWEAALRAWEMVPAGGPLSESALISKVEIHLARAFTAAREGISSLAPKAALPDAHSLSFLGQSRLRVDGAVRELKKFARVIEKLLPEARRKELGIGINARHVTESHP